MIQPSQAEPDGLPAFAGFGPGSRIHEPFTVSCAERITVGANVNIAAGSWLSVVDRYLERSYDPSLVIGDGTSLGPDIVIACIGRIEIGPRVLTASRVFIGDTYHDYRDPHTAIADQPMRDPAPVRIGAGAFLGIGSIVLPGVNVGERAYVAGGAVVTSDVPPNTVVAGNPARVVKRWDDRSQCWVSAVGRDAEHRVAVAEAQLAAAEVEVRTLRARHEETIALLAEAERRRAAAEHWLEEHRNSVSWRLTAPLRAIKQAGRGVRARRARG
jgi:acetyltransferase-like isoleucine patch superfamily enzyme